MPTTTTWPTQELTELTNRAYNQLVTSITDLGYVLSDDNLQDLRVFYETGIKKLKETAPEENFEDLLSFSTGQLVDKFVLSDPSEIALFDSFKGFLRSFCPIDPFC
jgi:hypothetical protein